MSECKVQNRVLPLVGHLKELNIGRVNKCTNIPPPLNQVCTVFPRNLHLHIQRFPLYPVQLSEDPTEYS